LVGALFEQGATTATTIVLANLLTPGDFGLVAACTIIISFFNLITQFGFTASIVRRPDVGPAVASSLLWASLAVNSAVALAALPLTALAASAMGTPEAQPYVSLLLIVLPLSAFSAASRALLLRRLRFRAAYALDVTSACLYGVFAVALAAGWELGVLAVVLGRIASVAATAIAASVLAPISLFRRPQLSIIREDLGFSSRFFFMQGTTFVSKNMDYWAVGQMAGAHLLGIYFVAYVIPTVVRQRMTFLISDVLFPVMARIADDTSRVRAAYLSTVRVLAAIMLPILVGLALVTPEVISVFFGRRWSQAAIPMVIIFLAAAVESVTQIGASVFLARGKPGLVFWTSAVRIASLAITLPVAMATGELWSIAACVLFSTVTAAACAQLVMRREVDLRLGHTFTALAPALVWTATMSACVILLRMTTGGASDATRLVLLSLTGALSYAAVAALVFRSRAREALAEAVRLLTGRQSNRKVD
jgi:PST family polysaccharide transporter